MLQSRILSTLDKLDVLQRTHQEELSSVTAEREQMKVKLQRYIDFVKSAKSEQEDMQTVITQLIEKGVSCGFRS
jgi:DNA repair protein RadC